MTTPKRILIVEDEPLISMMLEDFLDALAAAGIPFLLATGGSDDTIAEAHRGRPLLSKPFTMDSVERALNGLS